MTSPEPDVAWPVCTLVGHVHAVNTYNADVRLVQNAFVTLDLQITM